jgi:hypothetical protein
VYSAEKPWYAHFLFKALEDGRIPSLDQNVNLWEPRLNDINADLGHKDRNVTWRHLANQTSYYGVRDNPGEADLLLPVAPDRLTVMRPFGTRLPVGVKEGRTVVPVGGRKYLILAGMKKTIVIELLRQAGLSRGR